MQGICSRLTPSIPCLCSLSSWFWFIHGLFLHFGFGLLFVHSEPSFGFRILHFWNIGIKARLLLFESVSASLPSSAFLHLGPLVELNSDKYLLNMLVWMCLSYISRISCDFLYFQYACKDEAVPKEELYLWSLTVHHRTMEVLVKQVSLWRSEEEKAANLRQVVSHRTKELEVARRKLKDNLQLQSVVWF